MTETHIVRKAASRAASAVDDLEVRLARIKDLIQELDRLGLKTNDSATEYAVSSMRCALALKMI